MSVTFGYGHMFSLFVAVQLVNHLLELVTNFVFKAHLGSHCGDTLSQILHFTTLVVFKVHP